MPEEAYECAWCGASDPWTKVEIAMVDVDLPKPGYSITFQVIDTREASGIGKVAHICPACFILARTALRDQLNAI